MIRRRHGITSIAIVVGLMLVTTATVGLTLHFGMQAQRTRDIRLEAQHRQILLAGGHAALAALQRDQLQPFDLPLPSSLHAKARVDIERTGDAAANATITVTSHERTARQQITFTRADGKWTAASAQLRN